MSAVLPMPEADNTPPHLRLRRFAERLAESNREAEPTITRILWFPHPEQVRLVEVTDDTGAAEDGFLRPYYYSGAGDFPHISALSLVRPEEVGALRLPEGWGGWDDAVTIFPTQYAAA